MSTTIPQSKLTTTFPQQTQNNPAVQNGKTANQMADKVQGDVDTINKDKSVPKQDSNQMDTDYQHLTSDVDKYHSFIGQNQGKAGAMAHADSKITGAMNSLNTFNGDGDGSKGTTMQEVANHAGAGQAQLLSGEIGDIGQHQNYEGEMAAKCNDINTLHSEFGGGHGPAVTPGNNPFMNQLTQPQANGQPQGQTYNTNPLDGGASGHYISQNAQGQFAPTTENQFDNQDYAGTMNDFNQLTQPELPQQQQAQLPSQQVAGYSVPQQQEAQVPEKPCSPIDTK